MVTVTWPSDWVYEPFHGRVMVCPAVKDHVNRHPFIGLPSLVTLTFAPNPPDHWLLIA